MASIKCPFALYNPQAIPLNMKAVAIDITERRKKKFLYYCHGRYQAESVCRPTLKFIESRAASEFAVDIGLLCFIL